jgi:putative colanic acid biosynthesis acetyltransferase WcaF
VRPNEIRFATKVRRFTWNVVWILFFRFSPRLFHPWRAFLLRAFGAHIGGGVHCYPSARIWAPWNLVMGENSCLADHVDCYCVDRVVIGDRVTVSQYSFLCTASHNYASRSMPLVSAPIHIGSDAWITADVFVAPGVTVGEGTVVLARSSVFNDLPPWMVARGNPATPVKRREITDPIDPHPHENSHARC